MTVDRASTNDLVMLATESGGQVPNCVGAVLMLTGGPNLDIDDLRRVIDERTHRLPRLRQRLVSAPIGCGRPVWVDDPQFDVARHIRRQSCPAPGDETALLGMAATICADALPPSRPRWVAVLVSGLAEDKVALILVLHHVLADGIGGLAVLASLMDGVVPTTMVEGPADDRARPTAHELATDAMQSRWQAIRALPAALRQLPGSFRSAGGLHPPPAGDCSLLHPTGPRRQIGVARVNLAALHALAKTDGATVNDALLAVVGAALRDVLLSRGETLDFFRVTVPVAGRHPRTTGQLGNDVAVLVIEIPGSGSFTDRLRLISARVRAARAISAAPSPAALVGPLFRAIAAMGGYRVYLRRQHRFHTIISNVRGPGQLLSLAGSPVESIVPIAVEDLGNVTVIFVALSYAGTLTVSVIADPDQVPDLPVLMDALQTEFDAVAGTAHGDAGGRPGLPDLSPSAS